MPLSVFDFAKGLYPRESRIAAAKRNAVGGKRKRCTKGKNCSAACIAAHMICLVDLPWVGSALTKAKAQIQAAKKNAPAPAAAPAATPAPQPAATPPKKTALDKIPTVETYKKWGVTMLEEGIQNLQNSPKFNPNSAAGKKAIGNMTEALKQLKAEAGQAAAAKAPPAPAPQPAAKPKPVVKVETVDKYKSFGLPFLEKALPLAEGGPAAQTTDGKKAIANIKQAISELKAQAPKVAPGAATVTPAAKPAPQPAATNQGATPAKLPVKAGSKPLDENKYDSGNFYKFYEDAKKLGLTKEEAETFFKDWIKKNNFNMAIESKDMPAFIKDFNKAAGFAPSAAAVAAAKTASNTGNKPTPLVKGAEGDKPQPNSPSNPQGLSLNQQIVWKEAFAPITSDWYNRYKDIAGTFMSPDSLQKQGKGDQARIARILQAAQNNSFTKGIKKIFNQVKVNDPNSYLNDSEIAKLPSSVRSLVDKFGQKKLKSLLSAVNNFTGTSLSYGKIRRAYRGDSPERGDETKLSPEDLKKKIAKYRRVGEKIQEFLEASKNRPAVPKFRGIPVDDARLKELIDFSKNGLNFKEEAMNSWSTDPQTARFFTSPKGTANNRVIFRTLNRQGSSVKAVSDVASENEILTPANARYKVVNYAPTEINEGGSKTKIHFFDVVEY